MIPHCLPLSAASPTVRQSVRQSDSTLRHHFQPLKLLPDTGKYPLFCSVTLQDLAASTGFHSSISSRPMVANDRPTVVRQSSDSVRQSSDSVRQCPTVRDDGATSDSPTVSDRSPTVNSDSGPTVVRQWSDSGPTVPTVPTVPTARALRKVARSHARRVPRTTRARC